MIAVVACPFPADLSMNETAAPVIVIVTLLGGDGPTGVEAHLHHIRQAALDDGATVYLVTPYTGNRLARAFYRPLKNARGERGRIWYRWFQAWTLRRQVRAILERHRHAIVTLYAQCPLAAHAVLNARADCHSGARVVATVHYNGSEADEIVSRGWAQPDGPWSHHLRALERSTLPRLDAVAFVSDFMRRQVNERLPALRSVPQATLFNFAEDPGPGAERIPPAADLIAVGTLEARKNQAFLLQVLAECKRLGKGYSLTVVGDGPDRANLEGLARDLGLAPQVTFLGFQRQASTLIPGHRALVHAAVAENCPVIIAEALACGRPVVAGAIGGIPEMFRDRIEGRYWNLDNPAQAAQCLIDLLDDGPEYTRTAAAARARYEAVFLGLRSQWLRFLLPSPAPA